MNLQEVEAFEIDGIDPETGRDMARMHSRISALQPLCFVELLLDLETLLLCHSGYEAIWLWGNGPDLDRPSLGKCGTDTAIS